MRTCCQKNPPYHFDTSMWVTGWRRSSSMKATMKNGRVTLSTKTRSVYIILAHQTASRINLRTPRLSVARWIRTTSVPRRHHSRLAYMRSISRTMGRSCGRSPVWSYTVMGTSRNTVSVNCIQQGQHKLTFRGIRRNYPLKKIQENNEAEIMEVVLEEARSSYPAEIVV